MNTTRLGDWLDRLAQRVASAVVTDDPDPQPALRPLRGTNLPAWPVPAVDAQRPGTLPPVQMGAVPPRHVPLAQERAARADAARDQALGALAALEDMALDTAGLYSKAEDVRRLAQTVRRAL